MTHPQIMATVKTGPRNAQATRDRLVRSAVSLMTERGYHATTTPQIARAANVAEGTMYRHFSSKQAMLNEIYRAGARIFLDRARTSPPGDCRARLRDLAEHWRTMALRDGPLVRCVMLTDWKDLLDARSLEMRGNLRFAIEAIVAAGKADGMVRAGPAAVLADCWLAIIRRVLEETAAGRWPPDHPSAALALDAAWDAIAAPTR